MSENAGRDQKMLLPLHSVRPETVDFGSCQGRSEFETAGVVQLRRGFQRCENAGRDQKMLPLNEHYLEITMPPTQTFAELRRQERQVRKDLILDAAQRVFGAKTYDKVSMAEIARAAGIAKSSIYTYYPNQEALFVEAAIRETNSFIDETNALQDQGELVGIQPLVDHFLDFYTRHEANWRMITLFSLYGKIGAHSAERLNASARRLLDCFEGVLLKENSTGPTRLLAHTLFAALSGIFIAFRNYPGRSEAEVARHMKRVGDQFADMFQYYLSSK